MQVPNHIIEKIIPILLYVTHTANENWPEAVGLRDELIRCVERDKFTRKYSDHENELHENLFQFASMYGDWLTKNDPEPFFTGGSGQAMDDIIDWAKEFTEKNMNRVWDGEWYDELEEFFNEKIKTA